MGYSRDFWMSVIWILLGLVQIVIAQGEVLFQNVGVCGIIVGLGGIARLMIYGPVDEWWATLTKKDKIMLTLTPICVLTGLVVGFFTLGPWGTATGFFCGAIVGELLQLYYFYKKELLALSQHSQEAG